MNADVTGAGEKKEKKKKKKRGEVNFHNLSGAPVLTLASGVSERVDRSCSDLYCLFKPAISFFFFLHFKDATRSESESSVCAIGTETSLKGSTKPVVPRDVSFSHFVSLLRRCLLGFQVRILSDPS